MKCPCKKCIAFAICKSKFLYFRRRYKTLNAIPCLESNCHLLCKYLGAIDVNIHFINLRVKELKKINANELYRILCKIRDNRRSVLLKCFKQV